MISLADPRARALQDWLIEYYKPYQHAGCTPAQLAIWLGEAETGQGQVKIRARDSVSGAAMGYWL